MTQPASKRLVTEARTPNAIQLGLKRGLVPAGGAMRLDGARVLPGLAQWFRNMSAAVALLVLGDSTGWDPGTTDGGAWPVSGGYKRWVGQLATNLAASSLDVTVRYHLNDFTNGNLYYQATRVLKTATAGLRHAVLPGLGSYTFTLAKTNANMMTGTRHFIAAKVMPTDWTPANFLTIISDWGNSAPSWSWSFGIQSTGQLWFSYTRDGTTVVNRYSTVAPSGVTDNSTIEWIAVDVQWNNGAGGVTMTFYTSTDGHTWTILGTPVVDATAMSGPWQGGAPYQLGCRTIGGGSSQNFIGNLYEVQVRKGGMYGPTILPTQIDSWNPLNQSTMLMAGGPQLDIVNASWPGMGLDQFDDPTNLPLLVPSYPYLGAIFNTAHNDGPYSTPRALADKWDRLLARVSRRTAEAEYAVLTQNPTLRTDGVNPPAMRLLHTARVDWLTGYARSRGMGVIDTYQTFQDYVAAGGALSDLLDPAGGPTQIIHPYSTGVTLQTQKVWDELGLGEAA